MADLPPELSRLGDALEHAVSRAIKRRRGQLRTAWALAAVVAAVPMAVGTTHLHLSSGDGRVPAGVARLTPQPAVAERPLREAARSHVATDDRVPPGVAAGRVAPRGSGAPPHPLDTMPPPVSARAGRGFKPGVATERVDRRPAFMVSLL